MSGNKIRDFISALEEGKTKDEAMEIAEISKATAVIQFRKWNISKGNVIPRVKKEKTPKSPIPGVPLPK